jgi:two-component system CheB/CheR fusion protein
LAKKFPIVGIGASAGGIEALEQFFHSLTATTTEMSFVIVMHLDPHAHSLLPDLLGRWTTMPVKAINDGERIEPGHVYVIPPDSLATIEGGKLHLRKPSAQRERTPVDIFFISLAADQGENAIGIVLSGAGKDGSVGVKAIKENGGFTIAQGSNQSQPGFKDMPESAVATGLVDLVLPVEHIAEWLSRLSQLPPVEDKDADNLKPIYAILRDRMGHDFSSYKTRTLTRRVRRRMQVLQLARLSDYVEALRKNPEEAGMLFRDLLIGVTGFFRDPEAFAALEQQVIPKLFEHKGGDDEVRVWVAGCASGEEVYSIAILLREHVEAHFKNSAPPKLLIFASDIDDAAIRTARAGQYPVAMKYMSPERIKRFFTEEKGEYRVHKELRDLCIFTDHDLIRDPPFSRLNLLSCRNLLIYMKSDLQRQIFPMFHYALRPGGFLFLGASEDILRHNELFVAVDKAHRIFQRRGLIAPLKVPVPQFARMPTSPGSMRPHEVRATASGTLRVAVNLVAEKFTPAYVIVNERWEILHSSARTGKYLEAPLGPPSRDLFGWARKEIRLDLRDALRKATETYRTVTRERIPLEVEGGIQTLKLVVEPIRQRDETLFAIVFVDVGPVRPHEQEAEAVKPRAEGAAGIHQLETELQETRERLQTTIEELENANEELKSSNEELLSVNEELQSTNEEMETSKEEIQSVNEELQTVNHALNQKIEELDRSNADLQNLFDNTQVAVIFLDEKLMVRSFTPAVREIFNLIPTDCGRPLADIVSRLDDDTVKFLIGECVRKKQAVERRVTARAGTVHYLVRVVPYRTPGTANEGLVVVFVDMTEIVAAEESQRGVSLKLSQLLQNTMEAVSSLAKQTASHAVSVDGFIDVFVSRLDSLSFTHRLLSSRAWASVPLIELIEAEVDSHPRGATSRVQMKGEPIWLKPHAALTLGIVFHDLGSHALKYGALADPSGKVQVSWSQRQSGGEQRLEIIWREMGGQRGGDSQRALGFELIQRTLSLEAGGHSETTFGDAELRCSITIAANPDTVAAPASSAAAD